MTTIIVYLKGGNDMSENQASLKKIGLATAITGSMLALPIASSAHFSQATLKKGMYSDDVVTLQKILKNEGYYKLPKATGYFGTTTEKAVKAFQKNKGLVVDGLVGPKTKAALQKQDTASHDKMLKQGDRGQAVAEVQQNLKKLGYYKGHIDGIFGPLTNQAVITFQKQNHISVDGIVGPETYKTLNHHPETYTKPVTVTTKEKSQTRATPKKQQVSSEKVSSRSLSNASVVKELYVSSTAYTAYCTGCSGVTATGIDLRNHPSAKVVAVDPSVIPLGSKLYVQGYGYAVAGDTGRAIKGKRIDLFMSSRTDALKWGRRTVKVKILELP